MRSIPESVPLICGSSSEPVIVYGKMLGAVFVVVTCTLQEFGQTSFMRLREIVETASYGGIKVRIPLEPTDSTIEPVYVS